MTQNKLTVKNYNVNKYNFGVVSTLIEGKNEAIVMILNLGFTHADARRIAADVLDSNKTLKTILISNADLSFSFGAETLKQIFPQVEVVTSPTVLAKIQAELQTELDTWGQHAPIQTIIPTALSSNELELEGHKIEIRGTEGILAHHPYIWIPSIKTIAGGLGVFCDMHVRTRDAATAEEREAWLKQLEEMKALQPTQVIPGTAEAGAIFDVSAIEFTENYLKIFEQALKESANSDELIQKIKNHYPNLKGEINLALGAEVNMGERQRYWA